MDHLEMNFWIADHKSSAMVFALQSYVSWMVRSVCPHTYVRFVQSTPLKTKSWDPFLYYYHTRLQFVLIFRIFFRMHGINVLSFSDELDDLSKYRCTSATCRFLQFRQLQDDEQRFPLFRQSQYLFKQLFFKHLHPFLTNASRKITSGGFFYLVISNVLFSQFKHEQLKLQSYFLAKQEQ
jgi:hypothetical protein